MPRLVVDLERLKYLHCGLGQFSLCFGRALLATAEPDWQPVFLLPAGKNPFTDSPVAQLPATVWRREGVQRWTRWLPMPRSHAPPYDVWHVTHQDSRFWPLDSRVPVVLTIHDLNFLRTKSPAAIRRRCAALQHKIDRAASLATGSAHAAGEIREHFQLRGKPIQVIPNGVCLDSTVLPQRPATVSGSEPFLFTIGDIRPSKNFHTLVDMLAHLPGRRLVIAGSHKDPYAAAIQRRAFERGVADRVCLPGRVSEAERMWLYRHCEALVFPSLAEGFGLPLIEAMHCGRPVFSSRCTSLPEVGGPDAFYWDSFEPEAMADTVAAGLRTFAEDPGFSDRLRQWSSQFTWPRVAEAYRRLYRQVAGSHRTTAAA